MKAYKQHLDEFLAIHPDKIKKLETRMVASVKRKGLDPMTDIGKEQMKYWLDKSLDNYVYNQYEYDHLYNYFISKYNLRMVKDPTSPDSTDVEQQAQIV